MTSLKRLLLVALALMLAACAAGPEAIRWGTDACDRCRMILSDRAFAAELVEPGGRVLKFDGVDELSRHLAERPGSGKVYVTNGRDGGLVPAESAVYLYAIDVIGPMHGHVISFATRADGERFAAAEKIKDGQWLDFAGALAALRRDDEGSGGNDGKH